MKRNRLAAITVSVICIIALIIPTFAIETRASDQIRIYHMNVDPIAGSLSVQFSVTGNGHMNKLGCESIKVYEKSNSRWVLTESLNEDDDGMSRSGVSQKNTIYCNSSANVEYKVVVTIYAEDDNGRDSRTQTFYVTGK